MFAIITEHDLPTHCWQVTDRLPTDGRLSADTSVCNITKTVSQLSADKQPTVGQQTTNSRLTVGQLYLLGTVLHFYCFNNKLDAGKVLISNCFWWIHFTLFKLKDDNDGFREKQSNLELQIKASEMEIETQAKRCAQLEGEIKGKVCNFLTTHNIILTFQTGVRHLWEGVTHEFLYL